MVKVKQRRGQRKASAWSRSLVRNAQGLTFREIAVATLRQINAGRRRLKKCGALAKSTGEPCLQPAMENGRCRFHGGRTPSGDEWHVIQADVSGRMTSMARFDRKLSKAEKDRKARRLKLMRATDAERAAYEKWLWARPAGGAAKRAARRAESRMRRRLSEEKSELNVAARIETNDPEIEAIKARLAELYEQRDLLKGARSGVFE